MAERIHSDLAKGMIFAIDARSGLRLPSDYILRDGDVINIVAATKRG
ncbi:MAG: TGS domain-containing protein [Candidatus Bathyarchaeia archaeon]